MEFKGNLEKKNALSIYTKKFVKLVGLKFTVSDTEDGPALWSSNLTAVTRGVDIDVSAMTFFGDKPGETIILRGKEHKDSSHWYNICYGALEAAGKVKPRQAGLAAKDPRFDLPFKTIPDEMACNLQSLEKAVLYWFGQIVKHGIPSTFKSGNEDRCVFVGDKCIYVTKPNSDMTRCMKIASLTGIYSSVGCTKPPAGGDKDHFVVFKMAAPEYDLHISGADMGSLIVAVSAVYKYLHKGLKELPLTSVSTVSDPSVALQLSKPKGFEQTIVRPVTKEQLKSALDAFAAKHGIVFESAPNNYGGVLSSEDATTASRQNLAGSFAAEGSGSQGGAAAQEEEEVPTTDSLACFLTKLNLEKYYQALFNQNIDLEVLECMDDTDLKNFGVKDAKEIELIKCMVVDAEFMEQVKQEVEEAQKNAKWQPKKKVMGKEDTPAPTPVVAVVQKPPQAPAPKKAPINFFDDSDDDLFSNIPVAAKSDSNPSFGSPVASSVRMTIALDDSDDDLLPPPPKKAAAPPTSAKKPIDLDDDDI